MSKFDLNDRRPAWHFLRSKNKYQEKKQPRDCAKTEIVEGLPGGECPQPLRRFLELIVIYARVARSQVLFMPLLLVTCAFCYSKYHYEIVGYKSFSCVAFSILFFNLAVNTISEYRDCQKGVDDLYSAGTKYRLVSGILPAKNVLILGITSFILASISGIIAVFLKPYTLIIPGIFAAGIALFYSEWPLGLKYKALGELCVFIVYGPLIFSSCILALTQQLCVEDLIFSIPFGILTTNVILANNIRDYEFEKDKTTTLPIKFGLKFAYFLLFFETNLAFLMIPFLIYEGIIPNSGFLSFLPYPLIFLSIKKIGTPKFINIFGVLQVLFALLMCLCFFMIH